MTSPSNKDIRDGSGSNWGYSLEIQSRWLDQDQYGHLNNSAYYLLADTIVNTYLVSECGLEPFIHPTPPSGSASGSASNSNGNHSSISTSMTPSLPTEPPTTRTSSDSNPNSIGSDPDPTNQPPPASSVIGLVISSSAQFFSPTSFPSRMMCQLRIVRMGKSSVTYQVGIFELPIQSSSSSKSTSTQGMKAAVVTQSTHVFVDRTTRRPVKNLPKSIRDGLQKLKVESFALKDTSRL